MVTVRLGRQRPRRPADEGPVEDQVYREPLQSGLSATGHKVMLIAPNAVGRLTQVTVWSALPANTDTMLVRLFRYRRLTATSPFELDQITNGFLYTSAVPFSFDLDISANIIPGFSLVPNDVIAVSLLYTPGLNPGMVNFLVSWIVTPTPGLPVGVSGPADPAAWPPS